MQYPVYTPDISRYTESIHKAIADGWISSQGEFLEKARTEASKRLETPYVVLVNNGTSATHLLYKALKFKHPNLQHIYVPEAVFVAVWNCALYEYPPEMLRVLPIDPVTLNPQFEDIEPNSAVVIVHNVGNVVNVPELLRLRPDIVVVEDCCEAFLETYEGKPTGTAGLCGAVSFFGNKIVTTGEGGLWYTQDKELYDFIHKSCHHGMTSERYIYDVLGYNYRMTNLQAALLYDQLRDIDAILERKTQVRDRYRKLMPDWMISDGRWMNVLRIPFRSYRDLAPALREYGIDTRPMFYPLASHSHLRAIPTKLSSFGHDELMMIPSSPGLTAYDQVYIVSAIRALAKGRTPPFVHRIDASNRELLERFVANTLPSTFRYFATRSVETCLRDHTLTLVITDGDVPIGYGHLDDRWIGLCILSNWQGRGYGAYLLDMLIAYAQVVGISELRLTVDTANEIARTLYERRGFCVQEVSGTVCRMIKAL
jgi:perosamine synthetase